MEEFRICSNCGYQRGFHFSLQREGKKYRIIFICPECGSSYDLNLFEDRIEELNVEKKENYPEK